MRLWLVSRHNGVGYDEYDAFVVRAESTLQARALAAAKAGDEGAACWREYASCEPISLEGDAGIVLGSYNAG